MAKNVILVTSSTYHASRNVFAHIHTYLPFALFLT